MKWVDKFSFSELASKMDTACINSINNEEDNEDTDEGIDLF